MKFIAGVAAAVVSLLLAVPASAQSHFNSCATGTGSNATVLIDPAINPTINGSAMANGDEVAVYSPGGLCAGAAEWTGSVIAVTVWGDDPFTSQVDGMAGGESLNFVVWDASTSAEIGSGNGTVNVSYDSTTPYRSQGTFLADAIYNLSSLSASNSSGNSAPSAAFSASPTSGTAPLNVSVDASASTDSDGNITSYAWDFGDGGSGTGVTASHNYTTAGTYTVMLTVTDNNGATDTATRSINVSAQSNQAPTASFTASPLSGTAPLNVNVNASASADTDGNITSYAWEFGDGGTATGVSGAHNDTTAGTYTLRLTVTDDDGATDVATRTINVSSAANTPPTASFSASPQSGPAPLVVSVDGSTSTDSDGSIVSYAWEFGDGGTASGATASHTYNSQGSYTLKLTVTDNSGAAAATTRQITVNAPTNQAPNASFTATPTSGNAPLQVNVNAGGSSDSDGTISSYSWDFGDGQSGSGVSGNHTFTTVGSYTVTLTVTDNDGATDTATRTITVSSPSNTPPTAGFTATPQTGPAPLAVAVDGTISSDPDGSIASYAWVFGDGGTSTQAARTHTYNNPGTYTLRLTVTDNDGASGSTTRQIVVTEPANVAPTASFSLDPPLGDAPLPVTVDGTASTDSDGSITLYTWDFGDGTSASGATAGHTYSNVGSFTVRLTVTDDGGATSTATRTVNVTSPSNTAPTASFTLSASNGEAPLAVSFDASASSDTDGSIASYSWDFGNGDSASGQTASYTFSVAGSFDVVLAVTDDKGAQASTSRTINVSPPPSQDGLVLHYAFDETSGNTATDRSGRGHDGQFVSGAQRSTTGVFGGALQLQGNGGRITLPDHADLNDLELSRRTISVWFRVNDRFEAGRKQVIFEEGGPTRGLNMYVFDGLLYVGGWNSPVEESGWNGAFIATGGVRSGEWHHAALVLEGSESIAANTLRAYLDGVQFGVREGSQIWPHVNSAVGAVDGRTLFHDGEAPSGSNNSFAGLIDDLRLYNESLTAGQVATLFEASGELQNQAPTARMVVTPPGGQAPATLTFDATSSSDPDGNIQVYRWVFGDGGTATGAVVTHRYDNAGTFSAQLTVVDAGGSSSVTSTTIVISPANSANQSPVARFSIEEVPDSVFARRFDAADSNDPDGIVDQYIWDFGDGTAGREEATTHVFPGAGEYVVKLTIVDNDGATATRQSTIQIRQSLPLELEVASIGPVSAAGTVIFEQELWTMDAPGGASDDPRIDALGYVHRPVTGDEEILVRVDSIENTDRWAFAGLMFRAGLSPDAPHVAMTMTPEQGPVFAYRLVDGGWEVKNQAGLMSGPVWLRIVRAQDVFEGQYSTDGLTWISVGTQTVEMAETVRAGIVASSNSSEQNATAVLADLHFGPPDFAGPGALATYDLSDAYPNPFNDEARFSLSISREERVYIAAYNVLGQRVAVLHDDQLVAETTHTFTLPGKRLPSGMYLIQVYGETFREVRRVTLAK